MPRFIVIVTAALLPLVILELVRPSATFMRVNGVIWTACGAAAVTLTVSAFTMLRGTTIHGLIDAVLIAPQRHPDVLFRPLVLPPYSRSFASSAASLLCGLTIFAVTRNVWLGCVVELLTALALDTLRPEPMHPGGLICFLVACTATIPLLMPSQPRLAAIAGVAIVLMKEVNAPFLRIAAGLALWLVAPVSQTRFGFYFAPLAWVAALPVASIPDLPALAFARRFLPLFVVLQTLHAMSLLLVAFPVAKTIASARREYLANG